MKKVLVLLCVLAVTGIASADLLTNGDFTSGADRLTDPETPGNGLDPVDWNQWHSGWDGGDLAAWNNREVNANGPYGDDTNYHMAIGYYGGYGAGVYQDVDGTAGTVYQLNADGALDAWWQNSGYLKLEFLDVGGVQIGAVESPHFTQAPNYDVGLPWANYALAGTSPAGTVTVRAILGTWGEGGTARFDNAVLTVVPEPATMALLGLGGLFLRRRRA